MTETILHSSEIALQACQKEFQWDRWNCPKSDFLSKVTSSIMDRESAFVQAISTAALIYTVTKNCSRGEIMGCGCETKSEKSSDTIWSGCSDKIDFGEHISELIFNNGEKKNAVDAQRFIELHNIRAGRIVSK